MIPVYLIRHGKTIGNMQRRYVGCTDEPLCEDGVQQIYSQKARYQAELSTIYCGKQLKNVYVSPMCRCRQTAELLFPKVDQKEIADFREMDFGVFEYKNYQELATDARYQAFIDSGGQTDFPEAEPQELFRERVRCAFAECMAELAEETAGVFVVHGGTIMAILDAYAWPHRSYFEWQIPTGAGYYCEAETTKNGPRLTHIRAIAADREF